MIEANGADKELRFLVCDPCRSCCLLAGPAGRSIAEDPPNCAGCGSPMRVAHRPPIARAS